MWGRIPSRVHDWSAARQRCLPALRQRQIAKPPSTRRQNSASIDGNASSGGNADNQRVTVHEIAPPTSNSSPSIPFVGRRTRKQGVEGTPPKVRASTVGLSRSGGGVDSATAIPPLISSEYKNHYDVLATARLFATSKRNPPDFQKEIGTWASCPVCRKPKRGPPWERAAAAAAPPGPLLRLPAPMRGDHRPASGQASRRSPRPRASASRPLDRPRYADRFTSYKFDLTHPSQPLASWMAVLSKRLTAWEEELSS